MKFKIVKLICSLILFGIFFHLTSKAYDNILLIFLIGMTTGIYFCQAWNETIEVCLAIREYFNK
jgi:hypothetical protein